MKEQRNSSGSLNYSWMAIIPIAIVTWCWVPLRQEAHSQTTQAGASSAKMEVVSTTVRSAIVLVL